MRTVPTIVASFRDGIKELRGSGAAATIRTERDLPMGIVRVGSIVLVFLLAISPKLGLGLSWHGLLGAMLVILFGFLFVTVSSRLTGEIGSSSNPISGMTIATLLMTCLIFFALGWVTGAGWIHQDFWRCSI